MEILKMFNHRKVSCSGTRRLKQGAQASARAASPTLLGSSPRRWVWQTRMPPFYFLWPALQHTKSDTRMGILITAVPRIILWAWHQPWEGHWSLTILQAVVRSVALRGHFTQCSEDGWWSRRTGLCFKLKPRVALSAPQWPWARSWGSDESRGSTSQGYLRFNWALLCKLPCTVSWAS